MNIRIETTGIFEKAFKKLSKRYKSLPEDLKLLKSELLISPDIGINLGNNVRKIRLAIKSTGKFTLHIIATLKQAVFDMDNEVLNINIPLQGRTTERTISHIVRIIKEQYPQVADIANSLKVSTRKQTFINIWNMVNFAKKN